MGVISGAAANPFVLATAMDVPVSPSHPHCCLCPRQLCAVWGQLNSCTNACNNGERSQESQQAASLSTNIPSALSCQHSPGPGCLAARLFPSALLKGQGNKQPIDTPLTSSRGSQVAKHGCVWQQSSALGGAGCEEGTGI